jgi:hypothetical protein
VRRFFFVKARLNSSPCKAEFLLSVTYRTGPHFGVSAWRFECAKHMGLNGAEVQ